MYISKNHATLIAVTTVLPATRVVWLLNIELLHTWDLPAYALSLLYHYSIYGTYLLTRSRIQRSLIIVGLRNGRVR